MEFMEKKVFCSSCGGYRNHMIIYRYEQEEVPEIIVLNNNAKVNINHSIIKCAGCDHISFAKSITSDFMKFLESDIGEIQDIKVYPEIPKVSEIIYMPNYMEQYGVMPKNLKNLYKQIVSSYHIELNIICAIGLRTLIEGICNELKISKGYKYDNSGKALNNEGKKESIEGQINGLFEKKHIIWDQTVILQRIREMGNAAAHELVTPTSKELYSAIKIVENLLENLYGLKSHILLKDKN